MYMPCCASPERLSPERLRGRRHRAPTPPMSASTCPSASAYLSASSTACLCRVAYNLINVIDVFENPFLGISTPLWVG